MSRGLLDTSTVILLGRITDVDALPDESLISAITLAELSVGPLLTNDETVRAARLSHLQQADADLPVIAFDDGAARAFGRVAADLRAAGHKPAARAYDALIAATAISRDIPLHTCNPADFAGIRDLEVLSVAHPDQA